MRIRWILVLSLLLVACNRANGPIPEVELTPATGNEWKNLTARDGSFSVKVPEISESRFKPDSAGPGFYQIQYLRMIDRKTGCLFNVSWEAAGPKPDLKRRIGQMAKGKELVSQKDIEMGGKKGVEATIVQRGPQGGLLLMRLLPGTDRVFTISIVVQPAPPKEQERPILEQGKQFLDSFQPNLQRTPLEDPIPALEWSEYKADDKSFTCLLPAGFQGAVAGPEFHGGALLPGRAFRVDWRDTKDTLPQLKARLKKVRGVTRQQDVVRDGLKGVEFQATGSIFQQSPNGEVYWLSLLGNKREYNLVVQGCKGDKTVAADARKLFDSFKPGK